MFETNTWDILDTAGDHVHTFEMTQSQVRSAIEGKFIPVRTSKAAGHNHKLLIRFDQKWKISKSTNTGHLQDLESYSRLSKERGNES